MKMMKRILAVMLVLCAALGLGACGNAGTTPPATTTQAPVPATTVPTSTSAPTVDNGLVAYKVTVVYPDGTPVVDVDVQICMEDTCYMPAPTDANGMVVFLLAEQEGYKTKLTKTPAGYEEVDYIYFASDSKEVTIQLVEITG